MVGRHLRERRPQKRLGVEFVDQAVPLAAFDPLVEGRQHPLRPHPRFTFRRRSGGVLRRWGARVAAGSAVTSPLGHYRRSLPLARHRVSIFLHPFAPPALPGFFATMGSDSCTMSRRLAASARLRRARLRASRSPPSEPSASNHRPAPMVALAPNPSAPWASRSRRSGLHPWTAGSPDGTAESSS